MRIGAVDSVSAHSSVLTRPPSTATRSDADAGVLARPGDGVVDQSRMSLVVQLIERLTGREVRLVPPTAYLVSAPPAPAPETTPFEVVVATDFEDVRSAEEGPVVVDVTAILRDGTSDRMILDAAGEGALSLFPGVSVQL